MIYIFILMAITGLIVLFAILREIIYTFWREKMYKRMFPLPFKVMILIFVLLLIAVFIYGVNYVYESLKTCL